MKLRFKLAALLATVFISTASLASPTTQGVYVSANFGAAYVNVLNIFGPGSITEIGGFAANANLGYQFNRIIAVEGGFSAYTDMVQSGGATNNAYTGHIAAKLMIPFTEKFNIFFKLGAGLISPEGYPSQVGLFYGAGLAFAITDQLDIEAQTSGVTQFFDTIGLYSAGLTYHLKT